MLKIKKLCWMAAVAVALFAASGESVDVTVRRAPYTVSTLTAKSEKAWAACKYCGSKISYERTYKRDVYNNKWIETTKDVPDVCRSCKPKEARQTKLNQREAKLDRDIEYLKAKQRIEEKERQLRHLRQTTR